jgi:hypothetical protein
MNNVDASERQAYEEFVARTNLHAKRFRENVIATLPRLREQPETRNRLVAFTINILRDFKTAEGMSEMLDQGWPVVSKLFRHGWCRVLATDPKARIPLHYHGMGSLMQKWRSTERRSSS